MTCFVHADSDDAVAAFVERLYEYVLGRKADPEGLEYWTARLKDGNSTGAEVVYGFVFSDEFICKNTVDGAYVDILYNTCLNRGADAEGRAYWISVLNKGFSRLYVLRGFIESEEFSGICDSYGIQRGGIELWENRDMDENITAYVSRCYQIFLGRMPDAAGLNDWTGQILENSYAAQNIPYGFVFSQEMGAKNLSNEDFVTLLYLGILDREPDSEGLADWVSQLEEGTTREAVYIGFIYAEEFMNLLGSYGLPFSPYGGYEGLEDLEMLINDTIGNYPGQWSVYVKNMNTGEYMVYNEQVSRAASLIKLFAMEAVYEQIESGAMEQTSKVNSLLKSMITVSSNEAFNELVRRLANTTDNYAAGAAFNLYLDEKGYTNTYLSNMLQPSSTPSAQFGGVLTTSVSECARVLEKVYNGYVQGDKYCTEMMNLLFAQQRRAKIPAGLPSGTKCGNKTGENYVAENDAAIVFSPNCDYVICICCTKYQSSAGAISKIKTISSIVYDYFN